MKVKVAIIALLAFVGLFLLNKSMNEKKEYIPGIPASDTPTAAAVREKFTVGFLPVT